LKAIFDIYRLFMVLHMWIS